MNNLFDIHSRTSLRTSLKTWRSANSIAENRIVSGLSGKHVIDG